MKAVSRFMTTALLAVVSASFAHAADQTVPGQGNANANGVAAKSPLVQSAMEFMVKQAKQIDNDQLRKETLDAIANPLTCVTHRAGLTDQAKQQIVDTLIAQGLVNPADAASIIGGVKAGVFPPVLQESSKCPQLPMFFFAAPGSAYGGHHSYPGGLPVHESNNETADVHLADEYRGIYGYTNRWDAATLDPKLLTFREDRYRSAVYIDQDIIIAAPLWHDWAKPIVFQWNADGSEFTELNFGGNGSTDAWGAPGDSRTGGHHILGIAETMKRGLSPAFVITQACAHSAPTSGNEYKVVNWLRAAAIIAGIDPVALGYLYQDSQGRLRLPALREVGDLDLNAAGQVNLLSEYTLHNLSDADFTYSGPAVGSAEVILKNLAPQFGYDPTKVSDYQNRFRNVVLSHLSAERVLMIYSKQGLQGVKAELKTLKAAGVI
jgi:hypothetical protein